MLKGFSGDHFKSCGEVTFELEVESISIHCEALLTDVDMEGINLGQPIINGEGISLIVNNGTATLKQDTDFTKQMDVTEERTRFKVMTSCKECLLPGTSIIKVLDNEENNDVVTAPQHYELRGISYSIPATLLRGTTGYIKVANTGSQNIIWQQGDLLTRVDKCTAPPPFIRRQDGGLHIAQLIDES
ncbi:hypothetical protein ABMA27_009137 [Loxostege sticticalis]|uniref:Uncharacterized protein n=1 Tax=Loxostege sticticalis TaxID=481309 RepID=A0ABR3HA10_LOXSC